MTHRMIWGAAVIISLLTLLIGYFRWKASHFERPSEIEESVRRSYQGYRAWEDPGIMFKLVNVMAEKPGFPQRLFKYLPLVKREGSVDVNIYISPHNQRKITLPDLSEIEEYDLFPSESVEIRTVTWSDSPVKDANIQLRVHEFKSRYVINGIHASIVSIVELMSGDKDERYHAQYKHTSIDRSDLEDGE